MLWPAPSRQTIRDQLPGYCWPVGCGTGGSTDTAGGVCGVCHVQAESWNVESKADDSPLTRADKDANAVICDGLARIGRHQASRCCQHAVNWQLAVACFCSQRCHKLMVRLYESAMCVPIVAAPHIPIVSEENRQVAFDIRKVSNKQVPTVLLAGACSPCSCPCTSPHFSRLLALLYCM